MLIGMNHTTILESLNQMKPLELEAVTLLRQGQTDYALEDLMRATGQLRDYTQHCQQIASALKSLPPVPVLDANMIVGFAL